MSATKKPPATSIEAYKSLDPIKVSEMHGRIAAAVMSLGEANYEQVAEKIGEKEERVWKRLNEVCKAGLIHNTFKTRLTKNKRASYIYAPGSGVEPVKKKERIMKGKSIADYSREFIKPAQSRPLQQNLF